LPNRADSRLLTFCRRTKRHQHQIFKNLPDYLESGDLLVMNDSRVMPARFFGRKITGGQVELLIERLVAENQFLAQIRASKAPKPGCVIRLDKSWELEVLKRVDDLFLCQTHGNLQQMIDEIGHIPLPQYIAREDNLLDKERYQTVYARHTGSVAAPTAGLHFDEALLQCLQAKGIQTAFLTLHVGAGTFMPVRTDHIAEHKMHAERFHISAALCEAIKQTKARNKRVIAVGTTSLRTLEAAAQAGELTPGEGMTDIFINPGYRFQLCDGLITNFHLPESTLLMLVSAFIGHAEAMALYQVAIEHRYRFYSYGDVTLLL
jgi:S-adenosylmethionine:tRNA ribosyltransferase-isomerase